MSGERVERRLAAILAADVVGYSRLMGQDEAGTLQRLRAHRRELIDPAITEHKGRIVKTTGDGILVEFASVVEGLVCAAEWQRGMAEHNAALPGDTRIEFRIGINAGDVVVEDDDIFGDGVNVAARLEGLAEPGGICVSTRVQEDAAGRLDLAFDDLGEQSLKNIARPVRVYRVRLGTTETTPTAALVETTPTLALPDKPSIAVLPFQNMSGDPEQEYFADGMVEEIITALSCIRWLFVIARNSTFTYKGRAVDVKRVGRELGVRYVLEGSVRKGAGRVRISAQLIEAETGTHLWADRFDGSLEDVFELQDQVARSVAGVIEPALQTAETRRSAVRPTDDFTAYDLYLRALAVFFPVTKDRVLEALGLLDEAIKIDQRYGPALSWAAICRMRLVIDWAVELETNRHKAVDLARKALQVGENDPRILANAAFVLARFGEDIRTMIGLVDRALALNPSFARGWYVSGILRLNAVTKLLLAIQDHPGSPPSYRFLAACYAHMGRLDEAHATITKLRAISPQVVPSDLPWRNSEHRELFLSGLRIAMGDSALPPAASPRSALPM